MIRYSTILLAAVAVLVALAASNNMVLPITALTLGFMLLGYSLPELLSGVTGYAKTLWMPLGFIVAAVAGAYYVFSDSTFQVLMGVQWCQIAPCIPIGIVIASFVAGNAAKFGSMAIAGEKLDFFGEQVKE